MSVQLPSLHNFFVVVCERIAIDSDHDVTTVMWYDFQSHAAAANAAGDEHDDDDDDDDEWLNLWRVVSFLW